MPGDEGAGVESTQTDQRNLTQIAWQESPLPTLIFAVSTGENTHPELRVRQGNSAAERLFDRNPAGAEISDLFARDNPRAALREVRASVEQGREFNAELDWGSWTAERWLAGTLRTITIEDRGLE